jgi:hypothetical protein
MALYRALPRISRSEKPHQVPHLEPVSFMVTIGTYVEGWCVYFNGAQTPVLLARERTCWNTYLHWSQHVEHLATGVAFYRDLDTYCEKVELHIDGAGRVSGSIYRNKFAGNYSDWNVESEFEIRV